MLKLVAFARLFLLFTGQQQTHDGDDLLPLSRYVLKTVQRQEVISDEDLRNPSSGPFMPKTPRHRNYRHDHTRMAVRAAARSLLT